MAKYQDESGWFYLTFEKEGDTYYGIKQDVSAFDDYDELIDYADEQGWFAVPEENIDTVFALERIVRYNTEHLDVNYYWSMEHIEEEWEDVVVKALKEKGIFDNIEYTDDPDDDDKRTIFKLYKVIVK